MSAGTIQYRPNMNPDLFVRRITEQRCFLCNSSDDRHMTYP
ncbi:MAG: hypothetical protein OJF50_002635 [Nitrospira sp.]|nr:hypothetical protein [Nitrospira sp.]